MTDDDVVMAAPADVLSDCKRTIDSGCDECSDQRPSDGLTETGSGHSSPRARASSGAAKTDSCGEEEVKATPYEDTLEVPSKEPRKSLPPPSAPTEPLLTTHASTPPPSVTSPTKKPRALTAPPQTPPQMVAQGVEESTGADRLPRLRSNLWSEDSDSAPSPTPDAPVDVREGVASRPLQRESSEDRAARETRVRNGEEVGVVVIRPGDTPLTDDERAKLHPQTVVVTLAATDDKKMHFKSGDWHCQGCGGHNFAKRSTCLNCSTPRGVLHAAGYGSGCAQTSMYGMDGIDYSMVHGYAGEWHCPQCSKRNFPRRSMCKWCYCPRTGAHSAYPVSHFSRFSPHAPTQHAMGGSHVYNSYRTRGVYDARTPHYAPQASMYGPQLDHSAIRADMQPTAYTYQAMAMRHPYGYFMSPADIPGNWDCWVCGNANHQKRTTCKGCATDKDKALPRQGGAVPRPGDWFCMECQNVNFSKRMECKICSHPRSTCSNELVLDRMRSQAL